jgi:hypothetical protein
MATYRGAGFPTWKLRFGGDTSTSFSMSDLIEPMEVLVRSGSFVKEWIEPWVGKIERKRVRRWILNERTSEWRGAFIASIDSPLELPIMRHNSVPVRD